MTIKYDKLTDDEALDILKEDFGESEVEMWDDRNHIISPQDVLYYADAYGDLEDAILLQGFDKTLPVRAHNGLLESGLDIFEAVNCNDLETMTCPSCDEEMWEIEIRQGNGYTSHHWIDGHGNITDDWVEFVEQPDNRIWNADKTDDHAPVLCWACSHDIYYDFPYNLADKGAVVLHFCETNEISAFSVCGGLVRWEYEGRDGRNWTDLWNFPGDELELAKAFATRNMTSYMNSLGWDEIAEETVYEAIEPEDRNYRTRRTYREIADEWAISDEPHPDLDFTYIIDNASFGHTSFWVADENRGALLRELTDLVIRKSSAAVNIRSRTLDV